MLINYIMYPDWINLQAQKKFLSPQEVAQNFIQAVVLRHLSLPLTRFMGGTALVLGYNNPRFSEDVDLTQVRHPSLLHPGLIKAKNEVEGWFGKPVILSPPKSEGRTWKLVVRMNPSTSLRLHIDSQPFKAYTTRPLVIEFSPLPPFVCQALEVDEIMAEKVIALAYRRYLGGRDLFDLWFHWLRVETNHSRQQLIAELVKKKVRERKLSFQELYKLLSLRLSGKIPLTRAREEWKRYLPPDFQKPSIFDDIVSRCFLLPKIIYDNSSTD